MLHTTGLSSSWSLETRRSLKRLQTWRSLKRLQTCCMLNHMRLRQTFEQVFGCRQTFGSIRLRRET
jgi:hypothetical protein